MEIMSAGYFYTASGSDFVLNKNSEGSEKDLYEKFKKADKNDNGVTYDEYLQYLDDKNWFGNSGITKLQIENAKYYIYIRNPEFYADGRLKAGMFYDRAVLQGIPCRSGAYFYLYETGGIDQAALGKDTVFKIAGQDIKLKEDTMIQLYRSGNIKAAYLRAETELAGVKYKPGTAVYIKEDGSVSGTGTFKLY